MCIRFHLEVHIDKVLTSLPCRAPFSTKIEAILQEVVIAYVSDYPTIVSGRFRWPQSGARGKITKPNFQTSAKICLQNLYQPFQKLFFLVVKFPDPNFVFFNLPSTKPNQIMGRREDTGIQLYHKFGMGRVYFVEPHKLSICIVFV